MARIMNEMQYDAIMKRVDELMFATDESTPVSDPRMVELDLLTEMVEEYEKENYPIMPPTLKEILVEKMKDMNFNQKDLSVFLGISSARLSEIISGKKSPTYEQARTMALKMNIDPGIILAVR